MREAVAQLLLIENEAKKLRNIAHALDAEENLNFYYEILEYKKLFQEQDRREKAAAIWKTFLDAKADRPVTIPDDKHKKIMKVRRPRRERARLPPRRRLHHGLRRRHHRHPPPHRPLADLHRQREGEAGVGDRRDRHAVQPGAQGDAPPDHR